MSDAPPHSGLDKVSCTTFDAVYSQSNCVLASGKILHSKATYPSAALSLPVTPGPVITPKRVVAVWPGELRGDRLIYAEMNHPEHRDYSRDGVVVLEI